MLVTSIFSFPHNVFYPSQNKFQIFSHIYLSPANAFHLDKPKILSIGNELKKKKPDSVRTVVFHPPPPPQIIYCIFHGSFKEIVTFSQYGTIHFRMFDTIQTNIQFAIFVGKVRYDSMTYGKPLLYCINSS